ncbi:MAG TPA: TetR/AcrR family transcriptional regulator [Cyclobacteriaceae bacterium]|nr:TetR/AcrR family transcriptional regulator [Cyclobacteriaceae bacterium]
MSRPKEFVETDVLEKAVKLFSQKGYNGISMQDLVDGLKLNRSSIYDTFGDKEQLFVAALKHYRQAYTQKMLDIIKESEDIKTTIKELLQYIQQDVAENKKTGCMMVNTAVEMTGMEPFISNIVQENMDAIEKALEEKIQSAQKNGIIAKKHSAKALSRQLTNTINGLRISEKLGVERNHYSDVMEVTMSLFD